MRRHEMVLLVMVHAFTIVSHDIFDGSYLPGTLSWGIRTKGLAVKIIAGDVIGPCPAPAADIAVVAHPAFAFEFAWISQVLENRRAKPRFLEPIGPDVAAIELEVPAR